MIQRALVWKVVVYSERLKDVCLFYKEKIPQWLIIGFKYSIWKPFISQVDASSISWKYTVQPNGENSKIGKFTLK